MDYEPDNLNECSPNDSVPIVKVRSKIFDLNRSVVMPYQQSMICSNHHQCNNNLTLSSSSGCSSQSSSSSAGSAFRCSHNRGNHQLAVANVASRYDPFRCSLTSSSSLSSTASFSSQSTFGSNPLPHSRGSLKEASRNFRDFIHCYEQSLLTCLSNVEPGYDGQTGKEKCHINQNDACVMMRDARQQQQQQQQLVIRPLEKCELQQKRSKNAPVNDDNCHQTFNKNIDVISNDVCGLGDECRESGGLHCGVCEFNEEDCCCVERVNALTKKKEQVFQQIETESSDHNNHHVSELAVDIREPPLKSISKNENELVPAPKESHISLSKLSLIFDNKRECTSSTICHHHISPNRKNPTDNKSDSFRQSLRLQLEKVRELREQYDRGYRCKEAIEKLEKLTNKSRDCDREWRANEQMLTSIQHKLESLIGTFQIRVDEIEGWARICPRDTYEIEFRHGKQRQVLRVKIGKASERIWDSGRREVSFRGSPKPIIVCRVREVKSGWRNLAVWSKRFVEIGVTSISMSELLESVSKSCPILLDANPSGSLKLRIFCQWQPNVDLLSPSSTGAKIALQKACPFGGEQNVSIPAYLKDGYPIWQNQHDRSSTSSIREKHPKFGLNKDLARSLLALPTYMDYDGHPEVAPCSSDKVAACANQFTQDDQDVTILPTGQCQIATIQQMLSLLKTSLEDYGGHAVEITLMSQSVNRLIHIYQKISNDYQNSISKTTSNDSLKTGDQKIYSSQKDDQTSAFIEEAFEFLNYQYNDDDGDASSDTDDDDDDGDGETKIIASFDSHEFEHHGNENLPTDQLKSVKNFEKCHLVKPPSSHAGRRSFFMKNLSKWNSILSIHITSALEQLDHIGSWILKSREQRALCRLQADTFAMEQIFDILSKIWNTTECDDQRQIDEIEPIGADHRVIELWNFFRHQMAPSELNRLIYSHYHISSLIAKLIMDYNLIGNISQPDDDTDDILNKSSEWFTSCFITNVGSEAMLTTEHSGLITIFNIRAFFELVLYEHLIKNPDANVRKPTMKLRSFLEIAIDLNRLLRMKTRKIALYRIEQILFKSFNINCYWIPVDLSLIVVSLLYEHHCNQETNKNRSAIKGQRSHTTNEVKKSDRLRELSKILTNWLAWLLEEARFEIHQHVLSGLESPCPLTRRASCYGLMYLFRLMKRIEEKKHGLYKTNDSVSSTIQTFYGQEMDSLLYLSLEDPDAKVRDEARRALKCLGSFSTNANNFSRKHTAASGSFSSLHLNSVASDAKTVRSFSTGPIHPRNGGELIGINKINAYPHHTGTSMPNLNLNGECWMVGANPTV